MAASRLRRFGYVVLNAWDYPAIPSIREENPRAQILLYKDMSSTRSSACQNGEDQALLPTGVGYCWADQNHPEWFLLDQNGNRIEWRNYPGHWWMDVGNSEYQATWAAGVTEELKVHGWDGIMMDNAIVDPVHYLPAGHWIPSYPTVDAYAGATESFLASVGPRVVDEGFQVIPNIGGADAPPEMLSTWVRHTSGALREHWSRYGTGNGPPFGGWDWERQMSQMEAVEAQGKVFLVVTYGFMSNRRLMRYARASFLLGWNGGSSAFCYRPAQGVDPWARDWTIGAGLPTGPRYRVRSVWRRRFTRGTVLVNPTGAQVTVRLGRPYRMLSGRVITSIRMKPRTGAVLRTP